MGQESSNPIDDSVLPETLSERSIDAVARLVREGHIHKIVALTGAGISTAAGIPDFRSPGTGLYNNLQRLSLPYAEAVFSIDYFRQNPRPFYILAKELYPGQFHPTVSHAFLALLARKGLLNMLFTQNIDCLERAAGVPPDRIVEAHGSFATQRCIDCGTAFPDAAMREHVQEARVPRCRQPGCGGLVKPDIVFFGESLPARFHELSRQTPAYDGTDLVLVLGTSLTVYPFAGLPSLAAEGVPRVLFNREQVGDLGTRPDDVLALGGCDDGVRRLAAALGWGDELEQFWRGLVGDAEADRQRGQDVLLVPGKGEAEKAAVEATKAETETTESAAETASSIDRSAAAQEVNDIADEIEAVLNLGPKEAAEPDTADITSPTKETVPKTEASQVQAQTLPAVDKTKDAEPAAPSDKSKDETPPVAVKP